MALDGVLRSLSSNYDVSSWKVCAEKNKEPTVVIRYTCRPPVPVSDMLPNGLCTAKYKRKSLSQTNRDQKRLSEFKQRRNQIPDIHVADRHKKTSPDESKCNDNENVNKVNVDDSDTDSGSQRRGAVNEKREVNNSQGLTGATSCGPDPSPPTPPATPRAHEDMEMDNCTASNGRGDGCMGGEKRGESGESGDSDTASDTASDTDGESTTSELNREFNRNMLKRKLDKVRDKPQCLGQLKRMHRNKTFNKIVLDQSRGTLIGRSDDVLLTCDIDTQEIIIYLLGDTDTNDLEGCVSKWSDIDRGGTYGLMIETLDETLENCMNLLRELV